MTTANHLINTLMGQDKDTANEVFSALIQDKLTDALEVAKVEIASTIMGDEVVEEEVVQEGEGMDAQRRWVRHVAAIGKGYENTDRGHKVSVHRNELKQAARKYFQSRQPHGAAFTDQGASQVRDARKAVKRMQGEEAIVEGGPTRKHFQQVADLIKEIPDEAKRKELAQHHAGIFKKQNPRFDHSRFYAAAGVKVDEALDPGSAPTNAQLNRNVLTNIRRAAQTLKLPVNPTVAAAGHRDFGKLAAKNPKAPGYMLMRKLAPNKAMAVQSMTSAGVPLGQSLEANPADFNQVLQRIKRFK